MRWVRRRRRTKESGSEGPEAGIYLAALQGATAHAIEMRPDVLILRFKIKKHE